MSNPVVIVTCHRCGLEERHEFQDYPEPARNWSWLSIDQNGARWSKEALWTRG